MSPPRGFDVDVLRVELIGRHPTLHLVQSSEGWLLRGSMTIQYGGRDLDWFAIEVDLTPVDSGELPVVREAGGRIPWTPDRHVNGDGTCCVCLTEDYFLTHPGPFDLLAFLDDTVRGYFVAQALVERGEPWPHGEWAHGVKGINDWFRSFLDTLSPKQLRDYLDTLCLRELKGHHLCPCGSGRRLRACHLLFLRRLRDILTPKRARELLAKFQPSGQGPH